MKQDTDGRSVYRGAAVARVSALALRAIEQALAPGTSEWDRALARMAVRDLIATAQWRSGALPPASATSGEAA
jgi:hypothetical protein